MNLLFIGGTGLISSACAELAVQRGHDLTLLNRAISKKHTVPVGAHEIIGDIHGPTGQISQLLSGYHFDAVVDFIAFTAKDVEGDLALFRGKTGQFVFISSASAYQKPPTHYVTAEQTPLENPYWNYSRYKIAC